MDEFSIDPTPNGPDKEANEKKLQEQLHAYQQAIREEWEENKNYDEGELAPEEIRDKTKELLTKAVPKAVAQLLYLSQHAANESVRLKAATFIVEKAIGKDVHGLVGDPLEELIRGLNK